MKLTWIRRRLLKFFVIAALSFFASLTTAQTEQDYVQRISGNYVYIYQPKDSVHVRELHEYLQTRIPFIEQQLRLNLPDTVRFLVTPTEDEWRRRTQGAPLWANGIADPKQGLAVLKSPSFALQYGPLSQTGLHEFVHLLLESGTDDAAIPKWLDEGLAQVLAGQMNYMDTATLGRAVASGRLLTLWQIEGMMGLPETGARLAYAESAIAVELLRERFGYSGISNLVHELRRGKREEEIFPVLFGMPIGAFESELFSHIRNTYGLTLVTDTELWISVAFVVSLFLAGFAVWRRKRRKLREWEDEAGPTVSDPQRDPSVPYRVNYTIVRSRNADDENADEENKPRGE